MSISYLPEQNEYKELTPFKRFVLQSFPWINENFDALTNYELMGKVIEYLNEVIANENALETNMTTLYEYVVNYFENLDVTDEINEKLNQIVIDGTLTEMIETYMDPYINTQNTKINQIENQVQSIASGSPLVASSTSEMTDTTRTYVNTTDGKWYYYDGDSWEIGGTYQSSELANGSIDILKLDDRLQENFITQYGTEIERSDAYAGYYNFNGAYSTDTNYRNFHIPLVNGNIYAIQYYNRSSVAGLVILDNSNNVIYKSSDASTGTTYNFGVLYFKCNQNNLTAYISEPANASDQMYYQRNLLSRCYSLDSIYNALKYDNTCKKIKTIDERFMNCSNTNVWGPVMSVLLSSSIDVYALEKGKTYIISAYNYAYVCGIMIIDFNNTVLYQSSNATTGSDHVLVNKTYTATTNGYILISKLASASYPTSIAASNTSIDMEIFNKFKGFKIGADGDSLSAGASGQQSYISQIASDNSCTVQNLSVGGGTIATGTTNNGSNRHWISTSVTNLDNDCNLIMLSGGVNDYWNDVPLGTFNESYETDVAQIDTTTFYGALDYMFRILLDKFYTQKIVFVTYHKINKIYFTENSLNLTFKDYLDAIYKVCDKYSIPVIDINKNSRFNTMLSYYKNNFTYNNDGVHPTTLGYEKFYNQLVVNGLNNIL